MSRSLIDEYSSTQQSAPPKRSTPPDRSPLVGQTLATAVVILAAAGLFYLFHMISDQADQTGALTVTLDDACQRKTENCYALTAGINPGYSTEAIKQLDEHGQAPISEFLSKSVQPSEGESAR